MADLPKERLAYQSPLFTNNGVNYFVPIYVTVRRTTEKKRGFLFDCLTTRAVHVEMVLSMDTNILCNRNGTPALIWSDNGAKLIGAEKKLRDSIEKCGGILEMLVRSLKRVLYTILGTRCLADEVLYTKFCLVEYALNSRPLTPVSADPPDLGAITLINFLLDNHATGIRSIVGVEEFDQHKRSARA